MEQNSTRRRRRPMQGTVPVSDVTLPMEATRDQSEDLLFPEFLEFNEIPKFRYDTRAFEEFQRSMYEAFNQFQREFEEYDKQLTKAGEEWRRKSLEELERMRDNLDLTEYVDQDGYHVIEAHSKDGKRAYIHKTKKNGLRVESITEIREDGKIVYESSVATKSYGLGNKVYVSTESSYSKQRNSKGVRYERNFETTRCSPRRFKLSRRYVSRPTGLWKSVLLIAIVAVTIYFVFFR